MSRDDQKLKGALQQVGRAFDAHTSSQPDDELLHLRRTKPKKKLKKPRKKSE